MTTAVRYTSDQVNRAIKTVWGISTLRDKQANVIDANLMGVDSLTIMRTGSGKSLCYQSPALLHDGLTVVVCPLKSLMVDQVEALKQRGVKAAYLNEDVHPRDQRQIERAARRGELALLYVSPERLSNPTFLAVLARTLLACFIVDEAHCVADWGADFRPEYSKLGQLRKMWPSVPIHAFTATATVKMAKAITRSLNLQGPVITVGSVIRPNLTLRVVQRDNRPGNRQFVRYVYDRIADMPRDNVGIVYAIRRADTELLAQSLNGAHVPAAAYHAGLDDDVRHQVQSDFMAGRVRVVVATIAFGMGIDHPHVRFLVHAQMPSSLEHYHQEIGRAGRDGKPADCVLFYALHDLTTWYGIFEADPKFDVDSPKAKALDVMEAYCTDRPSCRHQQLCDHFGQHHEIPDAGCGACDICNISKEGNQPCYDSSSSPCLSS